MIFAKLARDGDLDALVDAVRGTPGRDVDRRVFRWLCVAADFGHEDADDLISDLLEHTSLRYDDSGFEQAAAYWELALAYLRGADGLDRDLDLAETYLDLAFRHRPGYEVLGEINGGTKESYSAREALDGLDEGAREVLERALRGEPTRRVRHMVERVERLKDVNAPEVILENEMLLLREALAIVGDEGLLDEELRQRCVTALDRQNA
jgi:hypothetical protein